MSPSAGSECTAAAQQAGLSGLVAEQAIGREGTGSLVSHCCKHIPSLIGWMYWVGFWNSQLSNDAEPDALASCHGAGIHVEGGSREAVSPVVHVRLAEQLKDAAEAEAALQQVVSAALRKSGVLLSVNRMSKLDAVKGGPSIRCEALLQCAHVHAVALQGRAPLLACTGRLSPVKAEQSASTDAYTMMGGL